MYSLHSSVVSTGLSVSLSLLLCISISIPVDLQKVMYCAIEQPLDVHLPFSSQGKSIQSQGGADICKYRLHGSKPSVIDETALYRVYLPFHFLGEAFRFSLKEVDLSCCRTVGVS